MNKKSKFFDSTVGSFVVLILILLAGMLVIGFAAGVVEIIMAGGNQENVTQVGEAFRLFVSNAVPSVIAVFALKKIYKKEFHNGLGFKGFADGIKFNTGMFVVTAILFVFNLLGGYKIVTNTDQVLVAVFTALMAGIGEECLYRNCVCGLMMRKGYKTSSGIWRALLVSSLIFGVVHLSNITLTGTITPMLIVQTLFAAFAGFALGASYIRSKNLWGNMIAHTVFDLTNCLLIPEIANQLTNQLALIDMLEILALGCVLVAVGIYLLRPAKLAEVTAKWEIQ